MGAQLATAELEAATEGEDGGGEENRKSVPKHRCCICITSPAAHQVGIHHLCDPCATRMEKTLSRK